MTRPRGARGLPAPGLPPFDEVVTAHGGAVLRISRGLLPPADAEDAAAEALLAALEAYPRLQPDSNVRAWLVTITRRKALDVLRRQARQAVPVDQLPERAVSDEPDTPDDALWAAVRALPNKQRHAVAYRYAADLSYADVAALLGGTEAAARRAAADGIAALRRALPHPASEVTS